MRKLTTCSITLIAALTLLACGGAERSPELDGEAVDAAGSLSVYTVNYPLRYFAERIGGTAVEVVFPAPPGVDPAYWSPDAATVAAYQSADLILLNGADYAKWIARVSLPASSQVDTSAAIADRLIPLEDLVTHSHGPEGDHEHGGLAFTTWLDPSIAAAQATAVVDALIELRPALEPRLREALAGLDADLSALDRRLQAVAVKIGDAPLLFSHPVYQYLIRRYGLNGRSVHWEPDEAPNLDELRALLPDHTARWVIWEGAPAPESVRALEEEGVSSLVFAPCGNVPDEGDYLAVMERNVAALESAFPE